MKIPILKVKEVLDALLGWVRDNYNYYNDLDIPEQSWAYITFNGNVHGNFNYYTNLINLLSRGDESSMKLETRLMFDSSRASIPTIHIHLPGEAKGGFTPMNESIGFGGLDSSNNTYEDKANSSTATYELIITGANSEEIILIYELLYALFLAGHDTLQNYFETFYYSGSELMANPDIIPYNTFYRSFKITVGHERVVRSIVLNPTVSNVFFNGKGVDPETPEDDLTPTPYPPESTDWFITNLKSDEEGGIIPKVQFDWLGATKRSVASFIQKIVDKLYGHVTLTTNPHPTNVTQEFADTQITPLAVEATYTPTVWSYLVGLFTTVPKSVKEHIVKIWERLGLLEDKYILKYVVPVDSNIIELTTDKNGNNLNITSDFSIELLICGGGMTGNVGTIFLNEITADGTYYNAYGNLSGYNGINYRCGSIFHKTLVDVKFTDNIIAWVSQSGGVNSDNTSLVQFHAGNSLINVPHISKFTIKESLGSKTILAGSIITIKKK